MYFDFGRINDDGIGIGGQYIGLSAVIGNVTKSTYDFCSSLHTSEERRNENPMDRIINIGSDLLTRTKCPDLTILMQRWVPRSFSFHHPQLLKVIQTITVSHYDDVLLIFLRRHCRITKNYYTILFLVLYDERFEIIYIENVQCRSVSG